jgi:sugar lactone lactonase YvrE
MSTSREVCVFAGPVTKRAAKALPFAASQQLRLRHLANRFLPALLVLIGLGTTLPIHGQSTIFMGVLRQTGAGSGQFPRGVVVDLQGNLWEAEYPDAGLTEYLAVNGALPTDPTLVTSVTVATSSITAPNGLAIDSAGDIWVSDVSGGIKEIVAVNGAIPTNPTVNIMISAGISTAWGMAFDASGNLWFCDTFNNEIKEALAVSGTVPANPTVNVVGSGFNTPLGVWVDTHGNVFVADTKNGAVEEMVGVAPPAATTPPATPTINTIGTGFQYPEGVAVDSLGNVWVADYDSGYFNEVVAVNGSIPASPVIIPFSGYGNPTIDQPTSVYIDSTGTIFLGASTSGSSAIDELDPVGRFGQVQAGAGAPSSTLPTSWSLTFLFGFTATTTVKTPSVYTQGATGLDFTDIGTGTCNTNGTKHQWLAGSYCTIAATFKPLYPGTRLGSVQLSSGSNGLSSALAYGDGVAPMINFGIYANSRYSPSFQNEAAASTTFQNVENIAVDPNHNIYFVDRNGCCIYEATAASNYQTATPVISTSNYPLTVSIDGAGDLIWDDRGSGQILEAVATNGVLGSSPPIVTLLGGITAPDAVVLDGNGDVFFADEGYRGVRELVAVNGQIPANPTIRNIENSVFTGVLAFDQYGNLYLASGNPGCLFEISPVGGQLPTNATPQQIICGLGIPEGLAVDAAGNVWESDFYSGLVEIQAINGAVTSASTTISWYGASGFGLGLDENGSVFGSFYGGGSFVEQFDFRDPPTFTWSGSTNTGETDPTTYTAFATDAGNEPITTLIPESGTNPSINPNWTWATTATNACPSIVNNNSATGFGTIGLNEICDLTISFSPLTGGTLTGQLTFTDDDLNAVVNGSLRETAGDPTQSITLNGTAFGLSAPTINWGPLAAITYGTALGSGDLNATAFSGGTDISADGTFTYYLGGSTITASTILPGGTDTLCANWTPSSNFSGEYNSAELCIPIQVNPASTSISWTPASPIPSSTPLGSGQFNASASAGSTPVTSDGTLTYYVGAVGGTVATSSTVLPIGSNTLCGQWVPSSSFTADYNSSSACRTIMVDAGPSITWTPATPITYPTALGSGQFNAAAFSGSTNIGADGTFTYYVTSVGGTVATSSTILPGGSDTLCVQWTPSSGFTSQYGPASLCAPIQVNAASTSISWSPSSTSIIVSAGPTAGQLDAKALAGATNVTADGMLTYHLSTAGGTTITTGTSLEPGPVTICAVWTPSSSFSLDYTGSSACQNFTVINTQPTTTSVTSNANPVFSTYSVTFTATVTPSSGSIVPTGTVTFDDNGTQIGTGTLSASGSGASATATLTTSSLAIGSHPITASYPGDTNNQSSSTTVTLAQVIEDFSVAASAPTTSTVEPGASATYSITVSPVSPATTFPAAITLTAAGLPTGATYTLMPATIAAGVGSTSVTLTVTSPATLQAGNVQPQSPVQGARWPVMALALLLLPLAGRLRREGRGLSRMLLLVLLVGAGIIGAATLNGCGGEPSGYFGQEPSTSTITVTGTSGSLSHNASVSLTVE